MAKAMDLTGQVFGKLTVIERATDKKYKQSHWICQCECGNITKPICGSDLKRGHTTSCGCYVKEKMKKNWENENFKQQKKEKMKKLNEEQWKDKERMKGKSNPNYKDGITLISNHLRGLLIVENWFNISKKQVNYTCQLTGQIGGKLHTHHLYSFSSIILDAHSTYNIEIRPQVKDYSQEELKLLEDYVAEWHKDNSNAIVLCEEVHRLFHHEYGSKDNTPEQFEEFKIRYLNGEFNNSDSNSNVA